MEQGAEGLLHDHVPSSSSGEYLQARALHESGYRLAYEAHETGTHLSVPRKRLCADAAPLHLDADSLGGRGLVPLVGKKGAAPL